MIGRAATHQTTFHIIIRDDSFPYSLLQPRRQVRCVYSDNRSGDVVLGEHVSFPNGEETVGSARIAEIGSLTGRNWNGSVSDPLADLQCEFLPHYGEIGKCEAN
jgi:hypothetical protein